MSVFSVPVTIGVNEEEIAKGIQKNVEQQVIDKITKEVKENMYRKTYYSGKYDDPEPMKRVIKSEIEKIVREHENDIIELTCKMLADKLSRTKVVREAAGKTAEEVYKEN